MTRTAVITQEAMTPNGNARISRAAGPNLRRLRWAVRATLSLGVAVSVAANVLHARPHPISQAIAAWPPLALLLTVELISRVPTYRRSLATVRLVATAAIAGIAAWVSYWHMAGVAARYGETGASAFLLPLSVDGLVIVASVSLVEIAGRINATVPRRPVADVPLPASTEPPVKPVTGYEGTVTPAAPVTPSQHHTATPMTGTTARLLSTSPSPPTPAAAPAAPAPPTTGAPEDPADVRIAPGTARIGGDLAPGRAGPAEAPTDPAVGLMAAASGGVSAPPPVTTADDSDGPDPDTTPSFADVRKDRARTSPRDGQDHGSVPSETAAAVAYWYRRDPDLHPAEVGARIGRSERTVRRYWPPATGPGTDTVNGDPATRFANTVNPR